MPSYEEQIIVYLRRELFYISSKPNISFSLSIETYCKLFLENNKPKSLYIYIFNSHFSDKFLYFK